MKNFVNVAMRMEEAFYNISMYLYNKNVLEYAQIARSGPKSMILTIEGSSTIAIYLRIFVMEFIHCLPNLFYSTRDSHYINIT